MTQEEFTKLVESLKAQGMSEEDILGTLLDMFKEGKVGPEDVEKLAGSMGYEVTEEFKKMASPEEEGAPEGEISEEEVEEAQEIPESREESSESEESEEEETEEESSESEGSEEESEESETEEKEEARKLYGLGE